MKYHREDYKIYDMDSLDGPKQAEVDAIITDFTRGEEGRSNRMLALERGEVQEKWLGAVALDPEDLVSNYTGAADPVRHNGQHYSEVGTMVTPFIDDRGKKLAASTLALVTDQVLDRGVIPIGFANENSLHRFQELGYREAAIQEVPESFLAACEGCPFRPEELGKICCDSIMVHDGYDDDPLLLPDLEDTPPSE